jgi:hypothetical protein
VRQLPKNSVVNVEGMYATASATPIYKVKGDYFYHSYFAIAGFP